MKIAALLTLMLKTSRSNKSITRPRKGEVEVGGDGNGSDSDNSSGRRGGFDKKFHAELCMIAAPLTLMLRTSSSTDSSTSVNYG